MTPSQQDESCLASGRSPELQLLQAEPGPAAAAGSSPHSWPASQPLSSVLAARRWHGPGAVTQVGVKSRQGICSGVPGHGGVWPLPQQRRMVGMRDPAAVHVHGRGSRATRRCAARPRCRHPHGPLAPGNCLGSGLMEPALRLLRALQQDVGRRSIK